MSTRPNHVCTAKPSSTWVDGFYIPSTKVVTSVCGGLCDTMFSKCDLFSEVPVLAISGVVDTCSISTGDSWTEGTRGILRFQRKNVAFLKEPGGISRIPRKGIIKTPSSMQFPGISETVSTGLNSVYKKTTNPLCLQFIGIVPFEITGYKII